MTNEPETIAERLARPFPQTAIKQRPVGGNRQASYVDGATVIRRLNDATGGEWSFTVDRYWVEGNVTLALVTLTIPGMGSRQHIGVQAADGRSGEDAAAKGAITDGLKKAATLFGVALDLYGPDYESGEVEMPTPPTPRQAAPAPPQPQAARPATGGGNPITERQQKAIFAIGRNAGWTTDEIRDVILRRYGTEHTSELTSRQASEFIDLLQQGSPGTATNEPQLAM